MSILSCHRFGYTYHLHIVLQLASKNAGYECAYGGKWHVPELDIPDEVRGFDQIHRHSDDGLAAVSYTHLVKAFEYLVKNNLLTHNVKFIFEGEEEIGSPSLEGFCQEHKELLIADIILVSDTSMLGADL